MNFKLQGEAILLIALGAMTGWCWHKFYIVPHDEARIEIVNCMGDDLSESQYHECFSMIKDTK